MFHFINPLKKIIIIIIIQKFYVEKEKSTVAHSVLKTEKAAARYILNKIRLTAANFSLYEITIR